MRILFRTSGGRATKKELGFGHIFRSINLSRQFLNHKIFFLIEDYGGVKQVFKKNKIKNCVYLSKNINLNKDVVITNKILQNEKIDILVVDKYKINIEFFKKISNNVKIVYISDLKKIQFPVDLVINGFIGFQNAIIKNKYNSRCLVGPKYQIINKKFTENKSKKKSIDLLVTFGGYDESGLTEFILKRWLNMDKKIKIKIILGPGTIESKLIKKYKKKFPKILIVEKQTSKMYLEMQKTEFGLCAGGITSYEFARTKVPFGIICVNKHQKITAKEWEKKKIAVNLGEYNSKLIKNVDNFLKSIVVSKKILKKNNFNSIGYNTEYIQKEIIKLSNK